MDRLATLTYGNGSPDILEEDHGKLIPVKDTKWRSKIHHYRHMTDKARARFRQKKLKKAKIVCEAHAPQRLPNARKKLDVQHLVRNPQQQDYRTGLITLLSLAALFPDRAIGYTLIATILCGLQAYALRRVDRSFSAVMAVTCAEQLHPLFISLIHSIIPRNKWTGKHCVIKRDSVLDFSQYSASIQNFSRVKVKRKKIRSVDLPFPYVDTVALAVQAKDSQWKAVSTYLQDAAVIFLNCTLSSGWGPKKLPHFSITQYDPKLANDIIANASYMAVLLRLWWEAEGVESWADAVIQRAKASFGKQDDRYVSVEFDPKKLRSAVYYQVLLDFFNWAQRLGLMTAEELEPYRKAVKDVFDPDPVVPNPPRRAEDPDVFLSVMRTLVAEHSNCIAAVDVPYRKNQKQFSAAWREIGGNRYLVILESVWKTAYAKALRADKGIDDSILRQEDWALDIQKALVKNDCIKAASSGYRYRYDLFRNGTKDNTYVLAIPAELLG